MNTKVWTLLVMISLLGCSNSEPETPEKNTPEPIVTPEPEPEPSPEPEPTPEPSPEPVTYQTTLSWTTPTQREDNTELESFEVEAYYLLWGQDSENLTNQVELSHDINSYTVKGLEAGDYFFAIMVQDQFGNRSELSNQIPKTFP